MLAAKQRNAQPDAEILEQFNPLKKEKMYTLIRVWSFFYLLTYVLFNCHRSGQQSVIDHECTTGFVRDCLI